MNCDEIRAQLSAYADGALSADEAARLEEGLARCPDCRQTLARMQAMMALFDHAEPVPLPSGFEAGVRARLSNATAPRSATGRRLVVLAALAAAIIAVMVWIRPEPIPDPPPDAMLARLNLLQDYEVITQLDGLLAAEVLGDVEVIAALDSLEGER